MPHPAIAKDNVAVITGGASGIGLAAATHFAALGMKVCIADIGADRLKGKRLIEWGWDEPGRAPSSQPAMTVSATRATDLTISW